MASKGNKMNFRRTGGLSVFRVGGAVVLASSLVGLVFACVDPKGDYEDYLERTNGIRGVQPDTGQVETEPFEAGEVDIDAGKGTYFVSCLPNVFSSSPETSMLMYSEVNISGGKLDFQHFPLKDTATKFAKSETVGTPHGITGVTINADNTYSAKIGGAIIIPGNSQRITDNDLELQNVSFEGRILSTDRWCAELNGNVTKPTPQNLTAAGDFCVIVKMNEGADLPKFTDSSGKEHIGFAGTEYHCP
jgi:hypothetical protein